MQYKQLFAIPSILCVSHITDTHNVGFNTHHFPYYLPNCGALFSSLLNKRRLSTFVNKKKKQMCDLRMAYERWQIHAHVPHTITQTQMTLPFASNHFFSHSIIIIRKKKNIFIIHISISAFTVMPHHAHVSLVPGLCVYATTTISYFIESVRRQAHKFGNDDGNVENKIFFCMFDECSERSSFNVVQFLMRSFPTRTFIADRFAMFARTDRPMPIA